MSPPISRRARAAVYEAASNYLDWNMYFHEPEED